VKPVIELNDVSVTRGGSAILDRVSWRVEPGEHWAVLGPNGSGKTTLLSVLSGHAGVDRGEVGLFGRRAGFAWGLTRPGVGLVTSGLLAKIPARRTVRETLLCGDRGALGYWRKFFVDEGRRAANVLRLVDCAGMARRLWGTLSQGERQRVLIGRALMSRPRLLILDEPCAGLDVVARERFLRFLGHLGHSPGGPTLLMATHQAEEITHVFRHLLMLRHGRVAAAGRVEESLTSENLSRAFGTALRVDRTDHRYQIRRGLRPSSA
jgi:iron complex transport system ATP-binding protein